MGELAAFIKRHPEAFGLAIAAVALLAYWQSRSGPTAPSSDDSGVTFTGGGVASAPVDPGVVAMEQARIDAGSRNIGTLSSLVLGLHQTDAALDAETYGISANLRSSLAQTEAGREVALNSIAGQVQMADIGARSSENVANIQANASTTAAQINAATAAQITQANLDAAKEEYATERDVARVKAKSSFWDSAFGFAGDVVSTLTLGLF